MAIKRQQKGRKEANILFSEAQKYTAKQQAETGKRKAYLTPLTYYRFKDMARTVVNNKNFADALATTFAFASISIAFPFLPLPILIPFLALIFIITMLHSFMGLITLLFLSFFPIMYQAPLLAWIYALFVSAALFVGYYFYRAITFLFLLVALPLSFLGYLLELPMFLLAIIILGFKRAVGVTIAALVILVAVSGMSGIPIAGPFIYNTAGAHAMIMQDASYASYVVPVKPVPVLSNITGAFFSSLGSFFSLGVAGGISDAIYYGLTALGYAFPLFLLQLLIWLVVIFVVHNYAIKSRSAYKGAESSLFGFLIPVAYYVLASVTSLQYNYLVLVSFLITPALFFSAELFGIDIVKALEVMKQDVLGKFGTAFEDLSHGSKETLDDVADYTETKREIRMALLAPIEHREISGAYGVKPAKGILLFGPPGTGKTLLMRAIANEVRASFFYVKTSNVISPYPGESAQMLSKIFTTAKKNAPSVLFFDEIDAIAGKREQESSESSRELMTALLTEMDGFNAVSGVAIVGATNIPNALDSAILRPGRFDKILYMPLPDQKGRAEILQYYFSRLPASKDLDFDQLASLTSRYSGADLKNIADETARQVSEAAIAQRKVLIITMKDIIKTIKSTKPSTTMSQLEDYTKFKVDYERRAHPEKSVENEVRLKIDDVVGLEEAKRALYEAVEVPILHPDMVKKYDITNIKGVLLFGPPGTGKTMLLNAIAGELEDVHIFKLSGYDISRYGIEKALVVIKEAFDRAKENTPAIIFIDEIDALVPSREDSSELGIQITGEFLEEFDAIKPSSGIVVVGITNRPYSLDTALLRPGRFDKLILAPPPNAKEREEIFRRNLDKVPLENDVDFAKLAQMTEQYTGADIQNICRQAKMNALESSMENGAFKISLDELLKLLQKIKPSVTTYSMQKYTAFMDQYGQR